MRNFALILMFACASGADDVGDERAILPKAKSTVQNALLGARPQIWLFGDSITVADKNRTNFYSFDFGYLILTTHV